MSTAKQILFFITQIFCIACFAQTETIDSLKKVLPSLRDTARIDCLNELGFEYSNRYWNKSHYVQTDTALFYTLQAQKESQQLQYLRGIGKAFQNMGMIEEEHNNFIKSEYYTEKAITLLEKENMQPELHRARINLGYCLYHRGFYKQSIIIYKQELPYYETVKDTVHLSMIFRMIGRSYDMQGNSENAFEYYQKDFMIQKKLSDVFGIFISPYLKGKLYLAAGDTANAILYYRQSATNSANQHVSLESHHQIMSEVYSIQKKYDSTLYELRQNIRSIKSLKNDSLFKESALMLNYESMIQAFLSLKKFDSVILYSNQLLKFFIQGGDVNGLMPVLLNVASAYHFENENEKAVLYTNQLLAYAQQTGARRFIRDGYNLLWRIYEEQHKINLAYYYHIKYSELNDSLEKNKYISQTAAWQAINNLNIKEVEYKTQLKIKDERNNAKIEFLDKEKKTQLYVFISAIGVILLITVMLIRNNVLKRKKDQLQLMMTEANILLEKQKREQEVTQLHQQKTELELQALRAQMNPHFIFNCLNSINRFIIKNDVAKAADYLTKFAKLIRIVLEQSGKSFIPLADELKSLQLYMDLEALRFETPFRYEINCDGIDTTSVMIPTLLIQPFIENAIWHGLHGKTNGNGIINISMKVTDDILHCKICDNGIGRSATITKEQTNSDKKSLGINLTEHRLQLIDPLRKEKVGIEIHDLINDAGHNIGTCVDIKIPVKSI